MFYDLKRDILEEFALAQQLVDQQSGAISRWLWAREKKAAHNRAMEARLPRKEYKRKYNREWARRNKAKISAKRKLAYQAQKAAALAVILGEAVECAHEVNVGPSAVTEARSRYVPM